VIGEMDLFAQALRDLGVRETTRLIAITGTNGKTTTTTLVGEMLRGVGLDGVVAGNISPATLDVLMARQDAGEPMPQAWALELSSFQLETGPALGASATVLNVTDDHLDRYAGLDDYAATKAAVFAGEGVQVLNRDDARVMAMALPGRRVFTFGLDAPAGPDDFGVLDVDGDEWLARGSELLVKRSEMQLAGSHNVANALAALALCEAAGLPRAGLIAALKAFRGLPHRVEKVAERADGVTYDDSKGTNVGATVAALEGLRRKVVLIAGGDGKGQDFSPLKAAFARYARAVVLIGRDAAAIEAAVAAAVSSWSTPPTWTPPCCSPTPAPRPATWCCCRPPAPASTCSATTPTAPRSSSTRSSACPESAPHETRCQPFGLFLPGHRG
jgi:UDP-N-acetylmuramoylalanine--D-glutamate ligase